jgi:hypothetical protein
MNLGKIYICVALIDPQHAGEISTQDVAVKRPPQGVTWGLNIKKAFAGIGGKKGLRGQQQFLYYNFLNFMSLYSISYGPPEWACRQICPVAGTHFWFSKNFAVETPLRKISI